MTRFPNIAMIAAMALPWVSAQSTQSGSGKPYDPAMDLQFVEDCHIGQLEAADKPLAELRAQYRAALEKLRDKFQSDGNLDGVTTAQAALDDEAAGKLPDGKSPDPQIAKLENVYLKRFPEISKQVARPIAMADHEYLLALDTLVKRLTREGEIAAAQTVQTKLRETSLKQKILGTWEIYRGDKADGVILTTMVLDLNGMATAREENQSGKWAFGGEKLTVDWGDRGIQSWEFSDEDIIQGNQGGSRISMKRGTADATAIAASTTVASAATGKDPEVKIVSAIYGSGGKNADVTARVKELVEKKKVRFNANPGDLGADPTPGWNKGLTVKFLKNGIPHTKSGGENQTFIPENFYGPQNGEELATMLAGTQWKGDIQIAFMPDKTGAVVNRLTKFRWRVADSNNQVTVIWPDSGEIECKFDSTFGTFKEKSGKERVFKREK